MELSSTVTANVDSTGDFTGVTNPTSFDQFDFTFTSRIINARYWTHTVTHTVLGTLTSDTHVGAITATFVALQTDSSGIKSNMPD